MHFGLNLSKNARTWNREIISEQSVLRKTYFLFTFRNTGKKNDAIASKPQTTATTIALRITFNLIRGPAEISFFERNLLRSILDSGIIFVGGFDAIISAKAVYTVDIRRRTETVLHKYITLGFQGSVCGSGRGMDGISNEDFVYIIG